MRISEVEITLAVPPSQRNIIYLLAPFVLYV